MIDQYWQEQGFCVEVTAIYGILLFFGCLFLCFSSSFSQQQLFKYQTSIFQNCHFQVDALVVVNWN